MIDQKNCPCGGTILADTEDWKIKLCDTCYYDMGDPVHEPKWVHAEVVAIRALISMRSQKE